MKKVFPHLLGGLLAVFALKIPATAQVHLLENFNGNSIPAGWTVEDGGTGPDCRWMIHASDLAVPMLGSNYLFVNSDSAGSGTIADETITGPIISFGSASVVKLSYRHFFRDLSGPGDTAFTEVFNGSSWVVLDGLTANAGTASGPIMAEYDLSPYLNPGLRIRFRYVGEWAYYWAIDDLKIFTPASTNIGMARFLNVQGNCGIGLPFSPQVRVYNAGSQAQSGFSLGYQIAGQALVSEVYSGSLPAGDSINYTFSTPFNGTFSGSETIRAWTALSGDGDGTNDTIGSTVFLPPSSIALADFTGFNGSNLAATEPGWEEFTSSNPPQVGTSAWSNATTAQITGFGTETARINLYSNFRKEWMATSAFVPGDAVSLRFKIALTRWQTMEPLDMGSDDSLIVKVSTNCGQSWQNLASYTVADGLSNVLTEKSVSLAAYAGQAIRIAFYGTDGSVDDAPDYDIHIDDVQLGIISSTDLQVSSILLPAGNCGAPASFPVRVKLFNSGNTAQTSAPMFYRVSGQQVVSQTFSINLAPGQDTTLEFSTPVAIATGGNYTLSAWVTLPGDGNPQNDSVNNRPFFRPLPDFGVQDFTGFAGANLSGGWQEFTGQMPNLFTGSSWTVSSAAQTSAFGGETAKINLSSNFRNEWIFSPALKPENNKALRFRLAVTGAGNADPATMGSDDSLIVKVTTDCGLSWTDVASFTAGQGLASILTEKTVSLAAYAGQTIRIAFYATDGNTVDPQNYDLHIDKIQIGNLSPNDLQLAGIILPGGNCGVPENFPVKVRIFNSGSLPQTSTEVSYQVAGQSVVSQTFPINLQPGAEVLLDFTTQVTAPTSGNYSISAWVSLTGDANSANDSIKGRAFFRPLPVFPTQEFTSFTGTNLSGGWQEFSGSLGQTGGSAWTITNASQTTGFGTAAARVNLYVASKKEWMISPAIRLENPTAIRFKLAIADWNTIDPTTMGSDDSLIVRVTTNCGESWTNLAVYSAEDNLTNVLTEQSISLAAYTGQVVRVAFFATEGVVDDPNDYDVVLDDIQTGILAPNDLQLSGIILPAGNCGVPASFPVRVRLTNSGTAAQSLAPISYQVAGQAVVNQDFAINLAPGAITEVEFSVPVNVPNAGNYSISVWVSLPGDVNLLNDSIKNRPFSRPLSSFADQTFTGYTGANLIDGWQEFSGSTGSISGSAWLNSNAAQTTAFGSETARVNLYVANKKEWVVSPAINMATGKILRFKLAVTDWNATTATSIGSDDSVIVKITTDCGQSWQNLRVFTAGDNLSNELTEFNVSLATYVGQVVRVAFYATEGSVDDPADCDVHLDDIELINLSPNDVGVAELLTPSAECGLPSTFPLKVRLANFGTQAQSGINVSYSINGGSVVTEALSGGLDPGQTILFEFSQPISIPNAGVYVIRAWTTLAGDQDNSNDTLNSVPLSPAGSALPTVDFEAYDGANLSVVATGWAERSGDVPSGTTSFWTASSASQTTALGSKSARVQLSDIVGDRREWLVSPGFVPAPESGGNDGTKLAFRVALTAPNTISPSSLGGDDSLVVYISTNCGQSWNYLRAITAANNLTNAFTEAQNILVPLAAYAGQNCQIAFKATTGQVQNPQFSDLHIDAIQVSTSVSNSPQISGRTPIVIFPNPVKEGVLNLESDVREVPRFFSATGKEYFPVRKGAEGRFDVGMLPAGMYFLRISDGRTASFVIQ
jgi:hypothetical protein